MTPQPQGGLNPSAAVLQRPGRSHLRITRLIPFSEALSICQRASGLGLSIPGSVSAFETAQMAIVYQHVVPKTQAPLKLRSRRAHLLHGSD